MELNRKSPNVLYLGDVVNVRAVGPARIIAIGSHICVTDAKGYDWQCSFDEVVA